MAESWWREDRLSARLDNLALRGKAKRAMAAWFDGDGFVEVETPALQVSPGMEPHLAGFATELLHAGHYGSAEAGERLFLHTSPEFAMKKLLAGGMEKIWQLCAVYRNAEGSPTHSPEFRMLEWYRAGAGYGALMDDCEAMIAHIAAACGVDRLRRGDRSADPAAPFRRLTVAEAFDVYCGHDLTEAVAANPMAPPVGPLRDCAEGLGIRCDAADTFDDIFFRLMDDRIEPQLGDGAPCLLYDYPISMAALARPKRDDGPVLWAERVELYVCGVELANGFGELTDGAEQRRRFEADMDAKERLYGHRYPIDLDFIDAVSAMPDAAGMALGFDRLVMLLTGAVDIEDVLWAPVRTGSGSYR